MVKYKTTEEDLNEIFKIYKETKSVTETAKKFCNLRDLEYSDSSRKRISNLLLRKGITKSLEDIQTKESDNKNDLLD